MLSTASRNFTLMAKYTLSNPTSRQEPGVTRDEDVSLPMTGGECQDLAIRSDAERRTAKCALHGHIVCCT